MADGHKNSETTQNKIIFQKKQTDAKGSSTLSVHLTKNNKRRVVLDLRKHFKLSVGKDCKTLE